LVAIAVVVAIGIFVRSRTSGEGAQAAKAPDKSAAQGRPVQVTIAPAERRDVPVWLEGLGTVAAWQQVVVRAQVDGRLDRVLFTEGQPVKKGEQLAQIDPRPFEAQLHSAEGALARDRAQMKGANINLDRYKELGAQKLIAQQQVDDQAALAGQGAGAVQADEAAIETAKLNLEYARVRSPLDGVAGVRAVDPGNLVHATDANGLVVITQLDPVAVFVTVPQDVLPDVSAAMARGTVQVEAWSRDGLIKLGSGTLFVVDNLINQATATLRLKCKLTNPEHKLWPNQFVKARMLLDTRKGATVVAASAVQRGPQGPFVYLAGADNKAEQRPVEVALTIGDLAVIGKGVKPGERVVIEGQNQLRPGSALQMKDAGAGGGKDAAGGGRDRGGEGKAAADSGRSVGGNGTREGSR
jgi:multidrug efflux system membrane fusion protein